MKKRLLTIILIFSLFIGAIISYKVIVGKKVKNKTSEYLEAIGYDDNDISSLEIKHSFINKILSYNEWRIFVKFKSTPDITFAFTYRNKDIIKEGVNSTPELNKEEMIEYDNKFYNGELKSN